MLQMLMQNKIKQIPQGMIQQLEKNLNALNPQAFKKYQQARKNNNPEELLNETINGFTPQQKQEWNNVMAMLNNNQKQGQMPYRRAYNLDLYTFL